MTFHFIYLFCKLWKWRCLLVVGGKGEKRWEGKRCDFKDIHDLKTSLAFKESAKGPLSLALEAEGLCSSFKSNLTR